MAKLIDWDIKIDVRSSAEDKYEHLGRRTTQGSIFKVGDGRSCFVMTFAVLRRSYRLLHRFETAFQISACSEGFYLCFVGHGLDVSWG